MQKEGGDHFIEFMKIISNKQCQDDPDFDLRQVWKFIVMVFHANITKVISFLSIQCQVVPSSAQLYLLWQDDDNQRRKSPPHPKRV